MSPHKKVKSAAREVANHVSPLDARKQEFTDTVAGKAIASGNVDFMTSALYYLHNDDSNEAGARAGSSRDHENLIAAIAKISAADAVVALGLTVLRHGDDGWMQEEDQVGMLIPLLERASQEKGRIEEVFNTASEFLVEAGREHHVTKNAPELAAAMGNMLVALYRTNAGKAKQLAQTLKGGAEDEYAFHHMVLDRFTQMTKTGGPGVRAMTRRDFKLEAV
jgi:hypothetical protein